MSDEGRVIIAIVVMELQLWMSVSGRSPRRPWAHRWLALINGLYALIMIITALGRTVLQ